MAESTPDRIERIKRNHNISHEQAVRVALAEIRLEGKLAARRKEEEP